MTFCREINLRMPGLNYQQPVTLTSREAFKACIAQNDVASFLWNIRLCTAYDIKLAIDSKAFDVAKEICKIFDGDPTYSIWTNAANACLEAKEWQFLDWLFDNCIHLKLWLPRTLCDWAPLFKNKRIYQQTLIFNGSCNLQTCLHIAKTGGATLRYYRHSKLEMLKEKVMSLTVALATLHLPNLLLAELIKHIEQPFINFLSDYELEVLLPKKKHL